MKFIKNVNNELFPLPLKYQGMIEATNTFVAKGADFFEHFALQSALLKLVCAVEHIPLYFSILLVSVCSEMLAAELILHILLSILFLKVVLLSLSVVSWLSQIHEIYEIA